MRKFCTILAGLVMAGLYFGQTPVWAQQVFVGQDLKHDTSPPMRDVLRTMPAVSIVSAPYAIPNRFEPFNRRLGRAGDGPDTPDVLRQVANGSLSATVGINVEGLSDDDNLATIGGRIVPPDTNGDVGVDYYVQYINLIWAVYDKTNGSQVSGPNPGNSFWVGFGGPCETNNDGDPIVLYDHLAGRWVFSQFSINQGIQCVAVSTTGDPLGSYHRYAFLVTPGGQNDYPKMGLWDDGTTGSTGQSAYTFTTRDFGVSGLIGAGVMERDAMLNGTTAQFVKFQAVCTGSDCLEGTLPPHLEGPAPPPGTCPTFFTYYDAAYDDGPSGSDGVRNHELCVDWSNTNLSTFSENSFITGTNFDRFLGNGFSDCISPVFGGEILDCLAAFTMYRAQYRWWGTYATVVLNTTVDVGGDQGGVRWGELRSTDGQTGWSFHQESTYAPDGDERWMASIAMNGNGDIALGYSVAGAALRPAVRAAGQTADQSGTGILNVAEFSIREGAGSQVSSANRWGDYSALSVDPVDDQTFWYTQEYYGNTNSFDFKTRIASFTLPPPAPVTRYVATAGNDTGNDCTDALNKCATLAHAVSEANAGDTIDMAAGTYTLLMSLLIDKALIIQGQGSIVQ